MEYRIIRPSDEEYKKYVGDPKNESEEKINRLTNGIEKYLAKRLRNGNITIDEVQSALDKLGQKFEDRDYRYQAEEMVTELIGGSTPIDTDDFETERDIVENPVNNDTSHELSLLFDSGVILNSSINQKGGTHLPTVPTDLQPLEIGELLKENESLNALLTDPEDTPEFE